MASPELSVAEMQGLYGPFTMHERVVQKIWLQQDFAAARATLVDGRALEIVSPGRWNLLGGPDFKHAQLRIAGREVTGDIEVHFHAQDWTSHGHADNPAYADVVLHVLLFPPSPGGRAQRREDGAEIPALVLLPLLHRDLEEYAADDALEALTARDEWRRLEELANLPLAELRERIHLLAQKRWSAKLASARLRVVKLGFAGAAHHTALEVLGYRHNRVPMLATAERWPLDAWRSSDVADDALATVHGWQNHGVRPANHPRTRLLQYQQWIARAPDWPRRMMDWVEALPTLALLPDVSTAHVRRAGQFRRLREELSREVVADAVGGPRFDTLVCDGFLPLMAVASERPGLDVFWLHWFGGDLPDAVRRGLRKLALTGSREAPLSHGVAQGLLAWLIAREFRV
jgi:hypothetical protein